MVGGVMSYIEEITRRACKNFYIGPDNETPLILPGGLGYRISAASVPQIANLTGAPANFEIYTSPRFGSAAAQGFNFNAQAIAAPASVGPTWVGVDDLILDTGNDISRTFVTMTGDGSPLMWSLVAWHPTPTKVCLWGEIVVGFNKPEAQYPLIEMHRQTVGDDSTTTQFGPSGKVYYACDSWVPSLDSSMLNMTSNSVAAGNTTRTGSWFITGEGKWAFRSATLTVDNRVCNFRFTQYPIGSVRHFGAFNIP